MLRQFFLFLSLLGFGLSAAEEWSYKDADKWGSKYPECKGSHQSPIDLSLFDRNTVSEFKPNSPKLLRENSGHLPSKISLINEGHALVLNFEWEDDSQTPTMTGGPLGKDEYVFDNKLEFHWGATNEKGSGHTFSNSKTPVPLEARMLYMKREYGNITNASQHKDGIAIWTAFFMLKDKNAEGFSQPSNLKQIFDAIPKVMTPGSKTKLKPFRLPSVVAVKHIHSFISYPGSLDKPPCKESVIWMISLNMFDVSNDQMEKFRSVKLINGENYNNRPVQPLNGRILYNYVF